MNPSDFSVEANRRSIELLTIAVALVAVPHVFNLAAPVMAFFASLVTWRLAAARRMLQLPGRWILLLLTVAGAALVFGEYHKFYGREAGAALFTVGLGLKLMELRTYRDAYLAIFLAFFVAVTQYLFSQSIPMALYTLMVAVLLVMTLISLNSTPDFTPAQQLRMAGLMVLQALPLMLLLFVLFPRIPGPLWKLPDDEPRATTGLSDTIEPGSIGKLGLSLELAFRAQFDGQPPPPQLRYWRGPVFWQTDGRRWALTREPLKDTSPQVVMSGPAARYTVILEPSQQRWVFALDLPNEFPLELKRSAEFVLHDRNKITERRQFRLASHTQYSTGPLSEAEKERGLQLPDRIDPRLADLIHDWRKSGPGDRDLVDRALAYFRQQPFYYTLNPPLTTGDPVASFLFDTRRGFCEHYATAFVILMRLAGIPARVVTGYQGGLWNPVGRFIEVRQADAHAWSEVWLEETGWTRVDPTAAVAPERIEFGLDVDTQVAVGEIRFNPFDSRSGAGQFELGSALQQARLLWNSLDYQWNLWVLSYGPQNQDNLLRFLGIADWRGLAGWLAVLGGLLLLALALLIIPRRVRTRDPVQIAYGRFLKKLARHGFEKHPSEGASSFCQRVIPFFPEHAEQFRRITDLFQVLRYGRPASLQTLTSLRKLVRQLSL